MIGPTVLFVGFWIGCVGVACHIWHLSRTPFSAWRLGLTILGGPVAVLWAVWST